MDKRILILVAMASILAGCSSDSDAPEKFATTQNAIMYGTADTSTAHNAVVMLAKKGEFFCTGTLIHPDYVLTAAHCVDGMTSTEKKSFVVGVGNTESAALKKSYAVETTYKHEKYTEKSDGSCYNDIALLKLASSVPSDVAVPILPLPPEYAVTQAEINENGVKTEFSGFGYTEKDTYGKKLKMSMKIKGYCGAYNTPKDSTSGCYMGKYTFEYSDGWWGTQTVTESVTTDYGTIFYEQEVGGPCSGDSGGPAFVTRNGKEYVYGVTSYGDEYCTVYGVSTAVQDFYSWLQTKAPTVFADLKYENCTDGKDNDGDGKADCQDSDCSFHVACKNAKVENCTDKIDNDGDGLIDCADPDCAADAACKPYCGDKIVNNQEQCDGTSFSQNKTTCVAWDSAKYASGNVSCTSNCTIDFSACTLKPTKEICNDGIDNDQDGALDCRDADCAFDILCAENCSDHLDNDGDGKIDCEDEYCANDPACSSAPAREICDDKIDNDGDGFIDCDDYDCHADPACQSSAPVNAEDCSNKFDDDFNGLMDCDDPACISAAVCAKTGIEICGNGIDDDGNGLKDCEDPACQSASACTKTSTEICGNGIDDDGNGLKDCDDPACMALAECKKNVEICGNGIDDDGNGLRDCEDPACMASCGSVTQEICNDRLDNDGDGLIDCQDPDCVGNPLCAQTGEICNNKIDDDGDKLADCHDPDCANAPECKVEICNDQIDNDGDGLVDMNDPDCAQNAKSASDSCSAMPKTPHSWPVLPAIFGLFGLGALMRRRRD